MSAIVRISSGLPSGTDVPGGVTEGPLLTHSGPQPNRGLCGNKLADKAIVLVGAVFPQRTQVDN